VALEWCKGKGIDYGYGDTQSWGGGGEEYILPGSYGIDRGVVKYLQGEGQICIRSPLTSERDFTPLQGTFPYIFSSHALEHMEWRDIPDVLSYWRLRLDENGILFLYLPHYVVSEWRPERYSEHRWIPTVEVMIVLLTALKFQVEEYLQGYDQEGSFYIVARKVQKLEIGDSTA
jgi:hypothetical protein